MPAIIGIENLSDGFRIIATGGAVFEFKSSDMSDEQKADLDTAEIAVTAWLDAVLADRGAVGQAHLTTASPLTGTIAISATPLTGEWWA